MTIEQRKALQQRSALVAELLRPEYEGLDQDSAYALLHAVPDGGNSRLQLGFQQIDGMPNVVPVEQFAEAFALIGGV